MCKTSNSTNNCRKLFTIMTVKSNGTEIAKIARERVSMKSVACACAWYVLDL